MPSSSAEETNTRPSKTRIYHNMEPKALESRWNTGSGPFPMLSSEANWAFMSPKSRGTEKFPDLYITFSTLLEGEESWERIARGNSRALRLEGLPDRRAEWLNRWKALIDNPSSRMERHPAVYRRLGTHEVILDGMRPHSREAFLARVKSTRPPGYKALDFEYVGATQSVCVDYIKPYAGPDVGEAIKETLDILLPKDEGLFMEVNPAVRRNLIRRYVSIYAKVKEMLEEDLSPHEDVIMDDHWSTGRDLEKLDDSICAILLDNSAGYGGLKILGKHLQEAQAPRVWAVGEQKYSLIIRRWREICEVYGRPGLLYFWRGRGGSKVQVGDAGLGDESVEAEAEAGLGIMTGGGVEVLR